MCYSNDVQRLARTVKIRASKAFRLKKLRFLFFMLPISNWLIYSNYPSQFLIVALSVSIFSLYSKKQKEKFAVFIIFFRAFS